MKATRVYTRKTRNILFTERLGKYNQERCVDVTMTEKEYKEYKEYLTKKGGN